MKEQMKQIIDMINQNQIKHIIILINLAIFGGAFYFLSEYRYEVSISEINKKSTEGAEYDEVANEYNTAKTFSSENNNDNIFLLQAFKRTLSKDGTVRSDVTYLMFIDSLMDKWDIPRDEEFLIEAKNDKKVKSSKDEYLYESFIIKFMCNYEQLLGIMNDLESYDKLFKIKNLKLSNDLKNKKDSEVLDIEVYIELDALTMHPKDNTSKKKKAVIIE